MSTKPIYRTSADVIQALRSKTEIALIDVREEALYAEAHPLFAVNLPLSRLEIEIYNRVPRRTTPIVVYDNGEGDAQLAAQRLYRLGYDDVSLLEGQLQGWRHAGGEIFKDVNVPSKAFGELVEAQRHTPSLAASDVKKLIDEGADIVIVDARRFDEYQTMNIPGSFSVPGAELVLKLPSFIRSDQTQVIVNCAGRTRSIIGTQSLLNAGLVNPVYALRNGTIGWTLAGLALEHQQSRQLPAANNTAAHSASLRAADVAQKSKVGNITSEILHQWFEDTTRTTYLFDVRSAEEYEAGHLPHARHTPGGQLVQETDHFASVRGARIVLVDTPDLTRAYMTGSWLRQMGWSAFVLTDTPFEDFTAHGAWSPATAPIPAAKTVSATQLNEWLHQSAAETLVLDVTSSTNYLKGHIPGAWFILRGQIRKHLHHISGMGHTKRIVVTCGSSLLARFAAAELVLYIQQEIYVLEGGNQAWFAAGYPAETTPHLASPLIDRYKRPYEGTSNSAQAMQAYLDWEFGLVQQLAQDGTHGFSVI